MQLTPELVLAARRELSKRSLASFVKLAWPIIEPATPYVHGRHIDIMCEHLEAVARGDIRRLIINIPPGTSKALEDDTPILTTWGWKRHGDLVPGDFVYGPDGQPKRVIACTQSNLEKSYSIRFDEGSEIVAGSGHLWSVERDNNQGHSSRKRIPVVVSTPDLIASTGKRNDQRPDRIGLTQAIPLPPRNLLVDPYTLGAWLGDGASDSGILFVDEGDLHNLLKIGKLSGTRKATVEGGREFHRVVQEGLQTKLRVLGILGNKHIPIDYEHSSIDQRLELLRGLMDTDGCAEKRGSCTFVNKNENIIFPLKRIIESLGIKCYHKSRYTNLNGKRYGPHHLLTFVPPPGLRVFKLDRKQSRVSQHVNQRKMNRYVSSVESVGMRSVKCIQVEGEIYLAGHSLIPTHNSTIVGVFFPMWLWGPMGRPGERFVGLAHEQSLGVRDNLKCRRLLTSEWFQQLWPVKLAGDQNEKLNFENAATGFRAVATPSNVTGRRGNFVLIDDPISVENANSEPERNRVNTWFQESLPSRMNDPEKSAIVLVMQRVHELDPTGFILSKKWGWDHLMLPMRYEPDRASSADWRTDEGELLFPERFPEHVVQELEQTLGPYATAGQLQQRPAPREGGLFKRAWFKFAGAIPAGSRQRVRAWDLAATKKATSNNPDWTAGVLMSRGVDGSFLIEGCERLRGSPMEVSGAVKSRAATDPKDTIIRLPQDPGQAGKAQAETFVRELAGYPVKTISPTGDKATRAMPAASQAEVGNVSILMTGDPDKDAWIEPFLDEVTMFPGAAHDDQVDAFADALNELALGGSMYDLSAWA